MEAGARVYGGVSAEERRARRREQLLEAGLELFGTHGYARTTMTAVCARAGLTERYFYEGFPDREALLVAVFDRITGEVAEAILGAIADSPREARPRAHAAIGAALDVLLDDPRKGRVAFVEAMGSEDLVRRRFDAIDAFATLLAEQARDFYGVPSGQDELIALTSFLLVGGLAESVMAWLAGGLKTSREQLVEDCTDLFVATGEAAVRIARSR